MIKVANNQMRKSNAAKLEAEVPLYQIFGGREHFTRSAEDPSFSTYQLPDRQLAGT